NENEHAVNVKTAKICAAGVPAGCPLGCTTGLRGAYWWRMLQLRTSILMKTDIVGSTPQFRALLSSDLQAVLSPHRAMVARVASEEGGRIFKSSGDGYWLDFPSATNAAKSAIAMHDAFRLEQVTKGDDGLTMRIVIGLGDTATHDGELVGDVL